MRTRTGHDRIVISLSSALGIQELGEPFALWGAVGIDAPRPEAVPVAAPPALGGLGDALERALTVTNPGGALAPRRSVPVLA
jgi:hypothetical protein